jgi:hypothetical protein
VQFSITGEANEPLWIDRSTLLPPDWQELTNLLNATGNVSFTDNDSTNDSRFFYRARQ